VSYSVADAYDLAVDMHVLRAIALRGRGDGPLPLPPMGSYPEPEELSAAEARLVMDGATRIVLGQLRGARTRAAAIGLEDEGAPQLADINNGKCVDWAELVCGVIADAVMTEWDDPQSGLLHTFVHWQGRFYDAERPDGAADVTGLPIFHRFPGTRSGPEFVRDTADVLAEYWQD
jgi:hypothetical protein